MESSPGAAWSLFLTAHARLLAEIEQRLAAAGLPSLQWYDALWALERAPDQRLRMSDFERHMVISRSNITRLIDRLETEGLVARERSEEDRRGAFAVLTPAGQALRKRMWKVYAAAIDALFDSPLTPAQRGTLEAAMRSLLAAQRKRG
jgi:DNA-binding MarR family transcriptional regulator